MIIDYTNRELIKDICLNEGIFIGCSYDYTEKELSLAIRQTISNSQTIMVDKYFTFSFLNVIYLDVQGCELGEESNQIACIYLDEAETKLKALKSELEQNSFIGFLLDKDIDFFTVGLEMTSGDNITVICESIDYMENDLMKLREERRTD